MMPGLAERSLGTSSALEPVHDPRCRRPPAVARALDTVARWVSRRSPTQRARMARALAWIVGSVLRIRRRHAEQAMCRAGVSDASRVARGMFEGLGRGVFELLALAGDRSLDPRDFVRLDDRTRALVDGVRRGERIVVATAHTAGWDTLACAVAADYDLCVITKRLSSEGVDAFWQRVRAERGLGLAGAEGALVAGQRAIDAGALVAMLIDQVPMATRHANRVSFLGRDAWVDRSPAVLACRANAKLALVASFRDDAGIIHARTLGIWSPAQRARATWIRNTMREITEGLEAFVREHPADWLWMHRRWREPPNRV